MKRNAELDPVLRAGRFFAGFVLVLVGLTLLATMVPALFFESQTAQATHQILNAIGIENRLEINSDAWLLVGEKTIQISSLCTGVLEASVLVAAILATFEVSRRKRGLGAIGGMVAVFVLNQVRIVTTILFIRSSPLAFVAFSHDVLFRVFLLVTIVAAYAIWLVWAGVLRLSFLVHRQKGI